MSGAGLIPHLVLVVEDDAETAQSLKQLLEQHGQEVLITKDGGQAQATFATRHTFKQSTAACRRPLRHRRLAQLVADLGQPQLAFSDGIVGAGGPSRLPAAALP